MAADDFQDNAPDDQENTPDDVVVAVTVQLEGSYLGVRADGRYRYLRVWKRVDGAWRVIGGSVVAIPPVG